MRTVFGILADRDGLASDTILGQGEDRPELRMRAWATPAEDVRRVQAPRIPIDRDHDGRFVGELVHLELRDGNLWAVGQVADDVLPAVNVGVGGETVRVEQDLFWSASRLSTPDYGDVIIDSVSLTPFPCRVAARPLTFLEGDLHNRSRWTLDSRERELLTRAAETRLRKRQNDPVVVYRPEPVVQRTMRRGAWIVDDELVVMPPRQPLGAIRRGQTVRGSVLRVS